MRTNERRKRGRDKHALAVHLAKGGGALEVRCTCGVVVGGQRFLDPVEISLSDLLELVRLHSQQVNSGAPIPTRER
jgi:hypothetical protein